MDDDEEYNVLAPKEPQVTSENAAERKEARALRIKKRQEAFKKAEYTEDKSFATGTTTLDDGQLGGPVETTVAMAAEELQRLLLDGQEHVTNIRAACDEREIHRRFTNMDNRQAILQKMEDESKEAEIKYREITTQWQHMLSLKDPLEIDKEMQEQTERCDDLMLQKDNLIAELKAEIKRYEDVFEHNLKTQSTDIKELAFRIETQIEVMKNAYQKQLSLIEEAIETERITMIDHNQKRWEALYKQRDREEAFNMDKKFQQVEEFDEAMDKIAWDHYEKFRAAKIALETEIQTLQKELQKLKATCLINTEKIDYNYQVLKKREEENVFVRSQQKRKLNKMQDTINSLRRKIKQSELEGRAEEEKANKEITKLRESMLDLEVKSEHFALVNDNKYQQVWRMNVGRCNALVEQIMQADRLIHEQLLGVDWNPPVLKLLKMTDLPSYKEGELIVSEKYGLKDQIKEQSDIKSSNRINPLDTGNKRKLVRHILSLVADNSGFLIEDRLRILLMEYKKCPANICKLDNVFNALEIKRQEDIELLCKYFMKFAFCPTCDEMRDVEEGDEEGQEPSIGEITRTSIISNQGSTKLSGRTVSPSASKTSKSTHITFRSSLNQHDKFTKSEQDLLEEAGQILAQYSLPDQHGSSTLPALVKFKGGKETRSVTVNQQQSTGGLSAYSLTAGSSYADQVDRGYDANEADYDNCMRYSCPEGHCLEIEEIHALTALREFVCGFIPPNERPLAELEKLALPKTFPTISRYLKAEDVETFWNKYYTVISPQTEKLWDGLLFGLGKYLPILKDRHQINLEVQKLREQNAELKNLLKGKQVTKPPHHKYLAPLEGLPFLAPKQRPKDDKQDISSYEAHRRPIPSTAVLSRLSTASPEGPADGERSDPVQAQAHFVYRRV